MPISSLIVCFEDVPSLDAATLLLTAHPHVTLGPSEGTRVPVVVETDSVAQDRDVFFALQDLDGVTSVQLVFLDFSDVEAISRSDLRGAGRRRNERPDVEHHSKNERTSA